MSELTLTVIRLMILALLWVFVFSVAAVLRSDLYGTRVVRRRTAPAAAAAAPATTGKAAKAPKPTRSQRKAPTTLTVTEGALTGTSVALGDNGVLLGRNPECTLVLDDDYSSGRHARLYRGPEGWLVEDLGSTNGTYLNEQRLSTSRLVKAGDAVRIGKTVFELRR